MSKDRRHLEHGPGGDGEPPLAAEVTADLEAPRTVVERARRYPLELPVELGPLRGLTRDISVTGVRFECSAPAAVALRVGDGLRIVLLFPSAVYGRAYRLHVEGRVVRVENSAAGASIALCTEGFYFGEPGGSGLAMPAQT
jgi:hypothetical protein